MILFFKLVPDKSAVFKFINYNLTKYSTINNVDKKVFLKKVEFKNGTFVRDYFKHR